MSNKEILEKAIAKAINGGWHYPAIGGGDYEIKVISDFSVRVGPAREYDFQAIIFNHDFAKALWGEYLPDVPDPEDYTPDYKGNDGWQYHLKRMVIAPDRIAYLGEHLDT